MRLKLKVKCNCGCKYEIIDFIEKEIACPNCGWKLSVNDRQNAMDAITAVSKMSSNENYQLSFSFKA